MLVKICLRTKGWFSVADSDLVVEPSEI